MLKYENGGINVIQLFQKIATKDFLKINSQHKCTFTSINEHGPGYFFPAIILRFITPFPRIQNETVIKIKQ